MSIRKYVFMLCGNPSVEIIKEFRKECADEVMFIPCANVENPRRIQNTIEVIEKYDFERPSLQNFVVHCSTDFLGLSDHISSKFPHIVVIIVFINPDDEVHARDVRRRGTRGVILRGPEEPLSDFVTKLLLRRYDNFSEVIDDRNMGVIEHWGFRKRAEFSLF